MISLGSGGEFRHVTYVRSRIASLVFVILSKVMQSHNK